MCPAGTTVRNTSVLTHKYSEPAARRYLRRDSASSFASWRWSPQPPRAAPKLTVTARPPQESVPQGREQQNETVVIRWGIQFRTRRRRRPPHTFRSRPLRSRVPGSTPPSHSLFALRQIHQHLFLSAVTRATPKGRLTARITVHCPACSPTSALAAHQPTAIPSARPSEPAQRQPLGRRWMICARPKT